MHTGSEKRRCSWRVHLSQNEHHLRAPAHRAAGLCVRAFVELIEVEDVPVGVRQGRGISVVEVRHCTEPAQCYRAGIRDRRTRAIPNDDDRFSGQSLAVMHL